MKKLVLLSVFIMVFLFKIDSVGAIASGNSYTYDFNTVKFNSSTNKIEFEGWVAINDDGNNDTHNINPKIELILRITDSTDTIKIGEKTYSNEANHPPYGDPKARPYDYTKALFIKHTVGGRCLTYPDGYTGERATSIQQSSSSANNHFAININFKFSIPVDNIINIIGDRENVKIHLDLKSALDGGTKTVYGKSFGTKQVTKTILDVAIKKEALEGFPVTKKIPSNCGEGTSGSVDRKVTINFDGAVDSVKQIAKLVRPRGTVDLDNNNIWVTGGGVPLRRINYNDCGAPGSYTPVYYYAANEPPNNLALATYIVGKPIKVLGLDALDPPGYPSTKMWFYPTYIKLGGSCQGGKTCVSYDSAKNHLAYISAIWSAPVDGQSTTIIVNASSCKTTPCSTKPGCGGTNGVPTTSCTTDCCSELCGSGASQANKNSAYCKTTCDACNINPSCNPVATEACPISCCAKLCNKEANKTTTYCTSPKYCGKAIDPCADVSDPQRAYCCKYPSDPMCKPPTGDEPTFPSTDPGDSKTDICNETSNKTINYKYPRNGWGTTLLTNNACKISCQETMKVTFGPERSVRAGMGFDYPITARGSRYCTSQYDNEGWQTKLNNAATAAKSALSSMDSYVKQAADLDNACGVSKTLYSNLPSTITSGSNTYGTDRSGLTYYRYTGRDPYCSSGTLEGGRCIKYTPYSNSISSTNSFSCVKGSWSFTGCSGNCNASCGSGETRGSTTSSGSCSGKCTGGSCSVTYSSSCNGTTRTDIGSASDCPPGGTYTGGRCRYSSTYSCPSINGLASSYNSSTDRCEVVVCERNQYKYYSVAQSEISSKLSSAQSQRNTYNSQRNVIARLYNDRRTCDNYVSSNQYRGASGANIRINNVSYQNRYSVQSSSYTNDSTYENARYSTETTYSLYQCTAVSEDSPSYNPAYVIRLTNNTRHTFLGSHKGTANGFAISYCDYNTIIKPRYKDYWNKKSDANLGFEFSKYYYVQRYTGDLNTTKLNQGYDGGGRYVYTDFFEKSDSHDFDIVSNNLGPNISSAIPNTAFTITSFACSYNVDNLIFPPVNDKNYPLYGSVAFRYRQISLTDPFPAGHKTGENWVGRSNLITRNGYKIYDDTPLYKVNLYPAFMQELRGYGNKYTNFYLQNPYHSEILERHNIKRGS